MKKIFTLVAATLFTVALFAADRRPVVTLKAPRNYEIVIDGQSYFSNSSMINVSNIRTGQHNIKVYEANNRGFMFKKAKRLVSTSTFSLRNNSVDITIGLRGQISITEDRFDHDMRGGSKGNDRDTNYGNDRNDNHDQDSRDKGQGNDKNDKPHRF
jgi:hypothetical protein